MNDPTPLYLTVRDVQIALGWGNDGRAGYKRAYRWLKRRDLLVMRAGRWVTTRDLLMTELPEVWDRAADAAVEVEILKGRGN